jgi:hypothetical protein
VESQFYDTPRGNPVVSLTPDSGIYNVPRALFTETVDDAENAQYILGSNPVDIYDYPRVSLSPDEEGIYDDPFDIVDMEIYDYPPDASQITFEEFISEGLQSGANSTPREFEARPSREMWQSPELPALPSGVRPQQEIQVNCGN